MARAPVRVVAAATDGVGVSGGGGGSGGGEDDDVTPAWSKCKVLTRHPREEGWRRRQSDRVYENTGG